MVVIVSSVSPENSAETAGNMFVSWLNLPHKHAGAGGACWHTRKSHNMSQQTIGKTRPIIFVQKNRNTVPASRKGTALIPCGMHA